MSDYKSVRLEERVYDQLQEQQRVRESLSQTLERILRERVALDAVAREINHILAGGE